MTHLRLVFALSLLTTACGGDDEEPPPDARVDAGQTPDAPPGPDAPPPPDADPTAPDAEPPPDADLTAPDAAVVTMAPVIDHVAWMASPGCTAGAPSNYTITFTVTDGDTAPGMLTYSGTISGCGPVNSNPDTVSCPNLTTYFGTLFVSDPEGNMDSQAIAIDVCTSGMAP